MLSGTKADSIFFKEYGTGHLYALKYVRGHQCKTSLVEARIESLDNRLKASSGTESTWFASLLDGYGDSKKVKSFSGDERVDDYLFRQIFNVNATRVRNEYPVFDNVTYWDLTMKQQETSAQDSARETEDLLVQQQVMEEDPEAFGGSTTMSSGSKMMAATSSSTVEEDDVESGGSTTEVILHEVIKGLTDASAAQQLRLEEALAAKEVAEEALASKIAESFLVVDKEVPNQEELNKAVEGALAAKKAVEQEFVAYKTSVEQEFTAYKTAAEQELLASKAAEAEALSAKTVAEEALSRKMESRKQLAMARTAAEEALAKEGRRADKAIKAAKAVTGRLKQEMDRHNADIAELEKKHAADKEQVLLRANLKHQQEVESALGQARVFYQEQSNNMSIDKLADGSDQTSTCFNKEIAEELGRIHMKYQHQVHHLQSEMLKDAAARSENEILKRQVDNLERINFDLDARITEHRNIERQRQQRQAMGNFGVDGVEEMEPDVVAEPTVLERLRSELAHEKERVIDLMATNDSLRQTNILETKRRKDDLAVAKLHAENDTRLAVDLEKSRAAKEIAGLRMEFDNEKKTMISNFDIQLQANHESNLAEKRNFEVEKRGWRMEMEKLVDTVENLEDELCVQRTRNAMEGVVVKKSITTAEIGTDAQVDTSFTTDTSSAAYENLLASERMRYAHLKQCCDETAKFLEIERAKVQELEQKLATGLETISGGKLSAAKQQAANAEKSAKHQAELAARAQKDLADVRREMVQRMDGAKVMLGDTYQCWNSSNRECLALKEKINKLESSLAMRHKEVERANKAEGRALKKLEELKQKQGSMDMGDLSKALEEAELNLQGESSLRRDVEAKYARLELSLDAEVKTVKQLRKALFAEESEVEKIAAIMRNGPFNF